MDLDGQKKCRPDELGGITGKPVFYIQPGRPGMNPSDVNPRLKQLIKTSCRTKPKHGPNAERSATAAYRRYC